jgi:hypothetical protein
VPGTFAFPVPTQRAAILVALAAPVALVIAAIVPGAWIAAPAFGRIAARAATYLNLPPTEPVNPSLTKVAKP